MVFPASPQFTDWTSSTLNDLVQDDTLGPTGPSGGATGPTGPTGPSSSQSVNVQTGTTYTLVSGDNGNVVTCNNAAAITLTVASGLGAAFHCDVVQLGVGQVTISPAGGVTVNNRSSFTKTAGQFAKVGLEAYSANNFVLTGDGA